MAPPELAALPTCAAESGSTTACRPSSAGAVLIWPAAAVESLSRIPVCLLQITTKEIYRVGHV